MAEALLRINQLKVHFPVRGGIFLRPIGTCKAIDGLSLQLLPGETLGLVGESGCGKTTLGKAITRLVQPTSGRIHYDNQDITTLSHRKLKPLRRDIQMIFQDPAESLNSRHTVHSILREPFIIHARLSRPERRQRIAKLLDLVGLSREASDRFPFEFSGGQRQRIGIARALAMNPRLVICDEPVSSLDVSVQNQILNLLIDLQKNLALTYLFIAHDLAVVKHVSDRIAVMYLGRIVEIGTSKNLYDHPKHPYTQMLIEAVPCPNPRQRKQRKTIPVDVPSPINPPSGCPFHPRCPYAQAICQTSLPQLRPIPQATGTSPQHVVACHFDL